MSEKLWWLWVASAGKRSKLQSTVYYVVEQALQTARVPLCLLTRPHRNGGVPSTSCRVGGWSKKMALEPNRPQDGKVHPTLLEIALPS